MPFFSFLIGLLITITPPSSFICDNDILEAKIVNNENGDYTITNDLERIDSGAFVVLDWKVALMLPRTFIQKEISFSDNKWKWIYQGNDSVRLLERKSNGEIYEYNCIKKEEA